MLFCAAAVIAFLVYRQFNLSWVLGGIILLGILALTFAKPETATLVVFFVLYANLSVVAVRSYGVPDLLATAFFALLGLPLLNYLIIRRQKLVINRVFFLMLGYLVLLLVSALYSEYVARSTDRLLSYGLEGLALYFLVINTVKTAPLLRKAIWVIILAGAMLGSLSLYQGLTGSYDNSFGGLAQAKKATIDTGRVDTLGTAIETQRLAGTLGSKNRYAQVMVVLLPLAIMRVWIERSRMLRILGAAACIPILAGALLTYSRGAGIAVIITLLAMVFLRIVKLRHALVIALVGCLFVLVAIPDYAYRISTVSDVEDVATGNASQAGGSIQSRATVNRAALLIFLDHPILGVGPGQTRHYTGEYGNEGGFRAIGDNRRAHNMYLEELADTGVVGFVGFMSIVLLTMHQLVQVRRHWARTRPDIAYTAASLLLAIIAYLATAAFLHLSYVRYYWFLLALACAAIEIFSARMPEEMESSKEPDNTYELDHHPAG